MLTSRELGRSKKVDPPEGSVIYIIGALESRMGGSSAFWILLESAQDEVFALGGRPDSGCGGSGRSVLRGFRIEHSGPMVSGAETGRN